MLWPIHSHRRLVNTQYTLQGKNLTVLDFNRNSAPIRSDPILLLHRKSSPSATLVIRWAFSYSITPSTVFSIFLLQSPNLLYLYYARIEWLLRNFQFCFVCFWWFWLMGFAYFFIIVLCFLTPWKSFKFLVLMNICIYIWVYV